MRISDVCKVTGLPQQTIKDLRHGGVLKMGVSGWPGESAEVRQWGSFSVPDAMTLTAANEMRITYGMRWPEAIEFAVTALPKVSIPNVGTPNLKYFDLNGYCGDVWVGRVEFECIYPFTQQDWRYFACELKEVADETSEVIACRNDLVARYEQENNCTVVEKSAPVGVTLFNASRLCRAVWNKVRELRLAGEIPGAWPFDGAIDKAENMVGQ